MLSVQADDLADVIEGLREGFHLVIAQQDKQKQADIQAFVDELDEDD